MSECEHDRIAILNRPDKVSADVICRDCGEEGWVGIVEPKNDESYYFLDEPDGHTATVINSENGSNQKGSA